MKRTISHILIGIAGWLIFEGTYALYNKTGLINTVILMALGAGLYFVGDIVDQPPNENQVGYIPVKG